MCTFVRPGMRRWTFLCAYYSLVFLPFTCAWIGARTKVLPKIFKDGNFKSDSTLSPTSIPEKPYFSPLYAVKDKEKVSSISNEEPKVDLSAAYLTLAVLLVTFASNQWCRQLLYYICDFSTGAEPFRHVNADLGFNEEQYATLASLGFSVVFTFFSFFAGSVSDSFNRKTVIALSCLVWAIATGAQVFAGSYNDMLFLRAILAAAQSFFNPAAYTLISDIFPPSLTGTANGIFSGGIFLGGGLASLSILLDQTVGWRNTALIVGAIAIVAALLARILAVDPRELPAKIIPSKTEPKVSTSTKVSQSITNIIESITDILSIDQARTIYLASAVRFAAGFAIVTWKAPFVFAKFPESHEIFASGNAAIVAIGGLLSSLLGGYLSDALSNSKADRVYSRLWVSAAGCLLAAPLWAGFILASAPQVALLCLLAEYLAAEVWFGPTLAALFQVVPKERRGASQGLFSVLIAIGNLGPLIVAAISNNKELFGLDLDMSLLGTVCTCYVLAGSLFVKAALGDDKQNNSQGAIDIRRKL